MRPGLHSKRPRNNRSIPRRGPSNKRSNSFDSNGPHVKVRGNANQISEKYQSLARDATSSGDRVMAENYLQHAEHYQRIVNANGSAQRTEQAAQPSASGEVEPTADDVEEQVFAAQSCPVNARSRESSRRASKSAL